MASAEKAVVIISSDGSERHTLLAALQRIELGNSGLTVISDDANPQEYAYSEIDKVLVNAEWNAVKGLTSDGEIAVWPMPADNFINISGVKPGETVTVYNLDGVAQCQCICGDGVTTMSLDHLQPGVYILAFSNQSVKFVKQ